MATLKLITKQNTSRKMFLALLLISVACAGIFGLFGYFYSLKAASFAFLGFETLLFCLMPTWVARHEKRRKAERAQWLADYKVSPESHILHLND